MVALAQWHEQEERQSETCDDILWCYSIATTLVHNKNIEILIM